MMGGHIMTVCKAALVAAMVLLWSTRASAQDVATQPIFPAWAQGMAQMDDGKVVLASGVVDAGATIATIPFSYRHIITLKADFKGVFGIEALPAGSLGFDAGTFTARTMMGAAGQSADLKCFFRVGDDAPYAVPHCYTLLHPNSRHDHNVIPVKPVSNLPIEPQFIYGGGAPLQVEDSTIPIDHVFQLIVSITRWTSGGAEARWTSEGKTVMEGLIPADANGQVKYSVNNGILTLQASAGDPTKTVVSFASRMP